MIYFIQAAGGGSIKIGHSRDVEARRRQLATHYGRPMEVLAVMEGGLSEERAAHRRFAHLRFGWTEQFRPAPELLAYIGRLELVDSNSGAVEAMEPAHSLVMARMDRAVVRKAKIVAAFRNQSLSEFLSDALGEVIDRLMAEAYAKESQASRGGKGKGRGGDKPQ